MPVIFACLSGSLFIAGQFFDVAPGAGLIQKIMNLKGLAPEVFADSHKKEPNFMATLKPGSLVCVPPGYILTTWAKADTEVLRWNWFSSGEDAEQSSQMTLRMLVAMTTAYPALLQQSGYPELKTFLDDDTD